MASTEAVASQDAVGSSSLTISTDVWTDCVENGRNTANDIAGGSSGLGKDYNKRNNSKSMARQEGEVRRASLPPSFASETINSSADLNDSDRVPSSPTRHTSSISSITPSSPFDKASLAIKQQRKIMESTPKGTSPKKQVVILSPNSYPSVSPPLPSALTLTPGVLGETESIQKRNDNYDNRVNAGKKQLIYKSNDTDVHNKNKTILSSRVAPLPSVAAESLTASSLKINSGDEVEKNTNSKQNPRQQNENEEGERYTDNTGATTSSIKEEDSISTSQNSEANTNDSNTKNGSHTERSRSKRQRRKSGSNSNNTTFSNMNNAHKKKSKKKQMINRPIALAEISSDAKMVLVLPTHKETPDMGIPSLGTDHAASTVAPNGEHDKLGEGQKKQIHSQNIEKDDKEEDEDEIRSRLTLPNNQYECTLRRRAIRKIDSGVGGRITKNTGSTSTSTTNSKWVSNSTIKINYSNHGVISGNININPSASQQPDRQKLNFNNNDLGNTGDSTNTKQKQHKGDLRNESSPKQTQEEEIVGDTSLGMEFSIWAGKVIVKKVLSLADGRASPAQLSGLISRGDILLGIEGRSLTSSFGSLSEVAVLSEELKPLKTPDENGNFPRCLRLRFSIGEGLKYLEGDTETKRLNSGGVGLENIKNGTAVASGQLPLPSDGAGDLFNLNGFGFVDQLSGMPMFQGDDPMPRPRATISEGEDGKAEEMASVSEIKTFPGGDGSAISSENSGIMPRRVVTPSSSLALLHETIAFQISIERQLERIKNNSGYYSLNEQCSLLLRPDEVKNIIDEMSQRTDRNGKPMTRKELIELGQKALCGAKLFCDKIEYNSHRRGMKDPLDIVRSECRSLSSRSRFSRRSSGTRPNPVSSDDDSNDSSDEESVTTSADVENNPGGPLDGDEKLFQLAAHNHSWKKRMVNKLVTASIDNLEIEDEDEAKDSDEESQNHLSLFFGEQVSRIIKGRKTVALPPDEMTAVLYDLAMRIDRSTPPMDVKVNSNGRNLGVNLEPNQIIKSDLSLKFNRDTIFALRFMLDEALPAWLDTFRPLQLQQRRVLWPLTLKDGLSVASPEQDSLSTSIHGASIHSFEGQIADLELDIESRQETCHLVTWYFQKKILSKITHMRDRYDTNNSYLQVEEYEKEAIKYVKKFGAYLHLHNSLAAAADTHRKNLIQSLLELAKFDLHHNEALKKLKRRNSILLYDSFMLSALLVQLPLIAKDKKQHNSMLGILASAYPSVKPWQLRKVACDVASSTSRENTEVDTMFVLEKGDIEFYYRYLCTLLHPVEGNDAARKNVEIVREWCILSTSNHSLLRQYDPFPNFMKVASRQSAEWVLYNRDVSFLLNVSINIKNYGLALELADEIINIQHRRDSSVLSNVLMHLKTLAVVAIRDSRQNGQHPIDVVSLRQIILLLTIVVSSKSKLHGEPIVVSDELIVLLELCGQKKLDEFTGDGTENEIRFVTDKEKAFVSLIANVIDPHDVLMTLSKWSKAHLAISSVLPALRICLKIGSKNGIRNEISGSLLRIQKIRAEERRVSAEKLESGWDVTAVEETSNQVFNRAGGLIWQKLLKGAAIIDK